MMLILGASEDQLPLYLEARRRGIPTIAVDQRTDRPALAHADEWLPVSIRDTAGIIDALAGRRPSAVVTAASDAGLWSWHELSHHFETPYRYPAAAARASADKAAFHEVARAAGVDGYRWRQHTDPAELTRAAHDIGFPLVVKPADNSGSKGVSLVDEKAGLAAALAYAGRFATSGSIVVEEFVVGRNLTIDIFMRDGLADFAGVTEKRIVTGPHFVIGGHTGPAALDAAIRDRLVDTAQVLCQAIELPDGAANFDAILRPDGSFVILEANARLCGNAVPLLMHEMYGVDTTGALLDLVVGEPSDLKPIRHEAGVIHVLASPLDHDAVLTAVRGVDEVRAMPGVVRCDVFAEPSATVHPFVQSANKIGYLVVTGPDNQAAETRLAGALQILDLEFEGIHRG